MTNLYKSDKCFDSCCTNPFPEVENPVVQGDKLTNELAPLVDVQDIQKVLKIIENDRNGRQHPLRIWFCEVGGGCGKETRHQFQVPWEGPTSTTRLFCSRVHKITADVLFGADFVVDPKEISTRGSTLVGRAYRMHTQKARQNEYVGQDLQLNRHQKQH